MDKKALEKIGGRKFALVLLVFVLSTALIVLTKLDKETYLSLVQLIILAYPAGNIAQRLLVSKDDAGVYLEDELGVAGGRKFGLVVLIYVTIAVLLYFNLLDPEIYVTLTQWLVATYISGNVASKLAADGFNISIGRSKTEAPA